MATKMVLVVAYLSIGTQLLLTALLTRLGATVLGNSQVWGTALAAIVLDFIVLVGLIGNAIVSTFVRSRPRGALHITLSLLSFALFVTASIVSVYVLGCTWSSIEAKAAQRSAEQARGLTIAGLVFWTINIIMQTMLYILILLEKRSNTGSAHSQPEAVRQVTPTRSVRKRSLSIHLKSFSSNSSPFSKHTTELPSPGMASYLDSSNSARSSFRHSLYQVVRPITSKTRLLIAQTPSIRDSQSVIASRREPSLEIACRGEGFEHWDTSAVEDQFAAPHVQTGSNNTLKPSKLDTIPGSRPVSPARVLDKGPFPGYTSPLAPEQMPLPESPLHSPVSPSDEEALYCLPPQPPPLRRPSSSSEAHIHPLFRTHSPTPPPTPSPGTVVTASPFAGQVVSTDQAGGPKRMLSVASSRPTTPQGSRAGSFRSARRPSALSQQSAAIMDEPEEVPAVPKIWRDAGLEESSAIE